MCLTLCVCFVVCVFSSAGKGHIEPQGLLNSPAAIYIYCTSCVIFALCVFVCLLVVIFPCVGFSVLLAQLPLRLKFRSRWPLMAVLWLYECLVEAW